MALYQFKGCNPVIGNDCFVAPTASVIGDVTIGDKANIWFSVVIRGDIEKITIGENTNVQDLSMLHTSKEFPLTIGKHVTIGHNAVIHGCTIEDSCLIGMGAIIMDGAVIGKKSVVAAGAVVSPGKIFPSGVMIMGAPAKVKRELSQDELKQYRNHYQSYVKTRGEYLKASNFNLVGNDPSGN